MRILKYPIACFAIFSFLVFGGMFGEGVLCIGTDGHIEIEPLTDRCCQAENVHPLSSRLSSDCCDCIDQDLTGVGWPLLLKSHQTQISSDFKVFSCPMIESYSLLLNNAKNRFYHGYPSYRLSPHFTALCTVILRC